MTDFAHLQTALERLHTLAGTLDSDEPVTFRADAPDLRLLLTSHAALLARAEDAEAALHGIRERCLQEDGRWMEECIAECEDMARRVLYADAAHPQPQAPVMGAEGA